MRRTRTLMLAAAMTLIAACGGDDGAAGDLPDATTTTTTAAGSSSTTEGSGGGGGGGDGVPSAECMNAVTAMAQAASAVPMAIAGGAADLDQSIEQLEAFADAAPAEIRDDMQTVAKVYAQVAKVLADANISAGQPLSPATLAALQKASEETDTEEFREASDRVSEWFDEHCEN